MATTIDSEIRIPIAHDEKPEPKSRRRTRKPKEPPTGPPATFGTYLIAIIAATVFLIPLAWLGLAAIATPAQFSQGAAGLLDVQPTFQNFYEAVTRINFGKFTLNSLILSTIMSTLTTATSATVGFAFARLRGRGQKPLFTLLLATMMIPHVALLIPTYMLFARMGLVGTYWPWVLWGLAGTPYLIFLFKQFFAAIPLDLEEAAIIDGCGWIRIYLRVFLPLAKPVLITSLILSFVWAWADYLGPALLLNYDNTTLSVATASGYLDPLGNGLPTIQAAGALLYLLPVVFIFLFAQKRFMGSAVSSGVKG
ncbi:carbohydrate ABC transporter permease [Demequina sp. SYSU T00192]|uniref:Carbohydrate ABC transporter permease n=1 Tax=Demequina litoralis TaxID=3051660 RepID=A0ABT8GCV0_9MICO|nr:carbohydrate ABC transporter permease [Demequina sp. SYSU T00192]MDN4476877.1 carbohydrate ABC transporter permease [Demequina sp. SYSU T00192]